MNKHIFIFCLALITSFGFDQPGQQKSYFWKADLDGAKGQLKMTRIRPIPADSLHPSPIIGFLNGKGSKPTDDMYIVFKKISKDTLYIKIKNTTRLTQQMGDAGAMMTLAEVTYNLTELKNIRFVNMDFEEGDHASPGTYSRKSFANE